MSELNKIDVFSIHPAGADRYQNGRRWDARQFDIPETEMGEGRSCWGCVVNTNRDGGSVTDGTKQNRISNI